MKSYKVAIKTKSAGQVEIIVEASDSINARKLALDRFSKGSIVSVIELR